MTKATGGTSKMNDEKKKLVIRTSIAFVIWTILLTGGFVFTGYKPMAQFNAYAMWLTIGLGAYAGKRVGKYIANLKFNNKK